MKEKTAYLVLRREQMDGAEVWRPVAEPTVRLAAEKHGDGVYVRVPLRSWHPATARKEQVTRYRINVEV